MQDQTFGNPFEDSWDDIAPKFSVDYTITEQVMGYAYERDAYQLINAKIGYEAESWDIYLYDKNIFDVKITQVKERPI